MAQNRLRVPYSLVTEMYSSEAKKLMAKQNFSINNSNTSHFCINIVKYAGTVPVLQPSQIRYKAAWWGRKITYHSCSLTFITKLLFDYVSI